MPPVPQATLTLFSMRKLLIPITGIASLLLAACSNDPIVNRLPFVYRIDIQQGITNGTFTELVSGPPELTVGAELVTNVLMPWLTAARPTTGNTQGNPFSGQQGRGGGGRGR